jgi:hypothetical protein
MARGRREGRTSDVFHGRYCGVFSRVLSLHRLTLAFLRKAHRGSAIILLHRTSRFRNASKQREALWDLNSVNSDKKNWNVLLCSLHVIPHSFIINVAASCFLLPFQKLAHRGYPGDLGAFNNSVLLISGSPSCPSAVVVSEQSFPLPFPPLCKSFHGGVLRPPDFLHQGSIAKLPTW